MFTVRSQRPVTGDLGWAEAILTAQVATRSKRVADITVHWEFLLIDENDKNFFIIIYLIINNYQM
jgi:hypothetical protein